MITQLIFSLVWIHRQNKGNYKLHLPNFLSYIVCKTGYQLSCPAPQYDEFISQMKKRTPLAKNKAVFQRFLRIQIIKK